jgi:hypothetical protein
VDHGVVYPIALGSVCSVGTLYAFGSAYDIVGSTGCKCIGVIEKAFSVSRFCCLDVSLSDPCHFPWMERPGC